MRGRSRCRDALGTRIDVDQLSGSAAGRSSFALSIGLLMVSYIYGEMGDAAGHLIVEKPPEVPHHGIDSRSTTSRRAKTLEQSSQRSLSGSMVS